MELGSILELYHSFSRAVQDDNMAFLAVLGSSFPAALAMKYMSCSSARQIFSISVAIIQTYLVCAGDTILPLLLVLCSYLALRVVPKRLTGRVTFHVSFSMLLLFKLLVFSEIFIPSYLTDAVLLLMVLRVVSYGYDYQLNRLGLPSLFDYVGYNFCFVGYWTGPFYDYNTYSKMLHSRTLIHSSRSAAWHMRYMLLLLPLYCLQNTVVPLDYVMTGEFLERSFCFKVGYQLIAFWTFKVKFYAGWIIAEAICMTCNLGAEEKEDGSVDYSSILNIDIYTTETHAEMAQMVRSWNKSVHHWMKTYVYETTSLPKSVKTDFVFAMSAFWHGVKPGYYISFLSGPPIIKIQQKLGNLTHAYRAKSRLLEVTYTALNWLVVRFLIGIFIVPFYIQDLDKILDLWASTYWLPQYLLLAVFILAFVLPAGSRPQQKPKTS